ncbi:glycerol dehydrogenase [Edwardsiella piscicida]|uniref:Glycerol dehydrogenase n=3 Tax=Edwardsiella TaxID=635 RepID=A0A0H3DNE8_EDWTF|nr:glycerol dehydrogenase [Edwardsiella piscicida]ACY83744.1 glycerol dehydrogenase [Edwardsiella tarda EIB202]ADM40958.1 Glycerol dehydrogenase [Edwardsiella tarda FL6-60]ARD17473.1 glycerol dehydrogenase [Edwardsiella piscicida]ELM3658682.1 glycerol dehydrogenase [Edwardsiella piscicida]ELM3736629.1 glycerol dehydrogenase [Edwardsiella piscicida]
MLKVIQSPSKYIQGPGALHAIGQYARLLADSQFVIADDVVMGLTRETVASSLKQADVEGHFVRFGGECSRSEIDRLGRELKRLGCRGVIGIGGGKTLDTAKALAHTQALPVLIVPTIASTDAPTSALSVIYSDQGEFEEYLIYPTNPDMVLMDTAIIAKAPVRLLVAGMGDALSTYFEAQACVDAHAISMAGGESTRAALALAHLCYQTLLEEGYKAKLAVEAGVATPAVDNIVEANTYLSGLGFESAGLAAAHAIHNGLTVLEECHAMYHGEKVAFGTLCQLVLQNSSSEQIETVLDFCVQVGLPVTLAQLGIKDGPQLNDKIMAVAEASCAKGETIHNMPFSVTAPQVYAAILAADRLGRAWLA